MSTPIQQIVDNATGAMGAQGSTMASKRPAGGMSPNRSNGRNDAITRRLANIKKNTNG